MVKSEFGLLHLEDFRIKHFKSTSELSTLKVH